VEPVVRDAIADVVAMLPRMQSTRAELADELAILGGWFHGYLHQDEFGPRKSEQIATPEELVACANQIGTWLRDISSSGYDTLQQALNACERRGRRGPAKSISSSRARPPHNDGARVSASKNRSG
jgi:hypothetical protein